MAKKLHWMILLRQQIYRNFQFQEQLLEKVGLVSKPEKLYWKHVKGWAM